eukprot:4063363-Amphidinium_carterae.2
MAIPTTFIIEFVSTAIFESDTITQNSFDKVQVGLHDIGHQFHIKAAMFNGCYKKVDYTTVSNWFNEWHNDFKQKSWSTAWAEMMTPTYQSTETTSCTDRKLQTTIQTNTTRSG